MPSNKITLIIMISLFAIAPLILDRIVSRKQRQQDARNDQLVEAYECYPLNACVADFNGDGVPARFEIAKTSAVGGDLVVFEGDKEILRLNYDHTDNTLRTHLAIHSENNKACLLVYDGVSYKTALRSAYEWNGDNLIEITPSSIEEEILTAMAAHDDTGMWNERTVFREIRTMLYIGAYYIVFIVVVGVVLYRRFHRSQSRPENKTKALSQSKPYSQPLDH